MYYIHKKVSCTLLVLIVVLVVSGCGAKDTAPNEYIEAEPSLELENGMMPFQRQGSDTVFLYLLLQEGGVYRLQWYDSMTHSGE